jgi:hypothetical protein
MFAWLRKKTGSLGEVPKSMSPPTHVWTRLCIPGPAGSPTRVSHPSMRFLKLGTTLPPGPGWAPEASLQGAESYAVSDFVAATWGGRGSVGTPFGSRPRRLMIPGVERVTNVPFAPVISARQSRKGPFITRSPLAGSPSPPRKSAVQSCAERGFASAPSVAQSQ